MRYGILGYIIQEIAFFIVVLNLKNDVKGRRGEGDISVKAICVFLVMGGVLGIFLGTKMFRNIGIVCIVDVVSVLWAELGFILTNKTINKNV